MEKRIEELEKRVDDLEREIEALKNASTIRQPYKMSQRGTDDKGSAALTDNGTKSGQDQRGADEKLKKEPVDLETLIGQIWLPRIFIIVLLIGCIFGFKVASDNHLLSPAIRIILGYAGSALLFGFGYLQMKKDRKTLGLVLFGGMVSLFMLTTFAANVLYHFEPTPVAFILNVLIVSLGIILSRIYRSEYLALFVGIGGFLLPFLIESDSPNMSFFAGYETLLYIALFFFALQQRYGILYYASILLLNMTFLVSAFLADFDDQQLISIAAGVLIQHVCLFGHSLLKREPFVFFPAIIFTSFAFVSLWWVSAFEDLVFNTFLIVAGLIYSGFAAKGFQRPVFASIATFACFLLILNLTAYDLKGIFMLIEGLIAFFIGAHYRLKLQMISGLIVYCLGAFMAPQYLIDKLISEESLYWLVVAATLALIYRLTKHMLAAIFLVFALLSMISQWDLVIMEGYTGNATQMSLSLVWAAFAVFSVLYGKLFSQKAMRLFGIIFLFFVLLKIIVIDLPIVSLWLRAVLFMAVGAVGVITSRFFYKGNTLAKEQSVGKDKS
ncbi:putative membrane protein DUF2339 [Scopulibacillus darangshiensis]|uniref:Putative membrane protein DUF2339 n=1 Tax=Scopulibacillus darangshiensis TaxID=442528 RepID=A0A4R2P9Z3_9BACL|nr:DUF2339 domain-containing protein [Scopulibacillus darangshiensis]TCP31762.1 putative membrane protein DUF2339 [Scopulibacillus darangshiensis]